MARMNISVPDPLYARLDRLRDRVNASKVCASALEKELDMIEGRTAPADPDIERLVQRLLSDRERWYERGREDGKKWAVQEATREQLYQAADEFEHEDGGALADAVRRRHEYLRRFFGSYDFPAALERWVAADASDRPATRGDHDNDDEDEDEDDNSPHNFDRVAKKASALRISPDVDLASYMEGWRDVIQEIWKAVKARLKR